MENFTGTLRWPFYYIDPLPRYTVHVNSRVFTGLLYQDTWEGMNEPCIYAGNPQGAESTVVLYPNDPVIEGVYRDYIVSGLFETTFRYSRFNERMCTAGDGGLLFRT